MAVSVTLSRDSTSVDVDLLESNSGNVLIGTDIGKPELEVKSSGVLNPRSMDNWSGLENYTLVGKFTDSNAYSDANTLCNLIKSYSGGNDLTLSIPLNEYDNNIIVAPAAQQEQSCTVTYPPSYRDYVEVDLTLTRVNQTQAGQDPQSATTPTTSGTGPIQLSNGSNTVSLSSDVEVERSVGRPNSVIRRSTRSNFPRYVDKQKAASDVFEISFVEADNPSSEIQTLVNDIFRPKLKRNSLTLSFNGIFGLGDFNVVPTPGGQSLRHVRPSSEQGVSRVPTMSLRRVKNA